MTNEIPKIGIHNVETGELIYRKMTDEEFAQYQKDVSEAEARQAEAQAKEAARQAILNKLGITAEEAQLLLGGN